jgi:dTDP-4-amino-4,6-dideoxygalactose transaminase
MINVTKSYLPPIEEYNKYLEKIWNSSILTNQGPLLNELEDNLKKYLEVKNFHLLTNGTIALQLALNALDIYEGEIITTPFSFVATMTTILWERCSPVFVDIEENNFCIDTSKIEQAITDKTKAIMAVHVFGYACNIDKIEEIAKKHKLKVIYDGAHAFGSKYKGKSLLDYGDITTCSFHATKLFHTIEGGACIVKDESVSKKLGLIKKFGFEKENYEYMGINAKNSEFHSAMGLANIKHIDEIIRDRKRVCEIYDRQLNGKVRRPNTIKDLDYNYSYYPVVFKDEQELLNVFNNLEKEQIYARRYFYPSLNTLKYLKINQKCEVSENISVRVACLPLYYGLEEENIIKICDIIKKSI